MATFEQQPPAIDIRPHVQELRSSNSEFANDLAEPFDFIQQALDVLAAAVSELQDVVGAVAITTESALIVQIAYREDAAI